MNRPPPGFLDRLLLEPGAAAEYEEDLRAAFGESPENGIADARGAPTDEGSAEAEQIGAFDSGSAIVRPDGGMYSIVSRKGLTQKSLPIGICFIDVSVTDVADAITPRPPAAFAQRLVLEVRWQTGVSGGSALVDGMNGTQFSVGGVHSIDIGGRILSPDEDVAPAAPGPAQNVECTLHWQAGGNPKPAFFSGHRITLAAGVESAAIPIPSKAALCNVQTTVPASAPGLIARFKYDIAGGAALAYRTDNPLANRTSLVAGVRAMTLEAAVIMTCTPVFELYL